MQAGGARVMIGPLMATDILPLFQWFNDVEAMRLDAAYRPVDWASHNAWFETVGRDLSKILFALRRTGTPAIIGYVTLSNINAVHRSAEIGLRIGEEKNRNQGLGTEAIGLTLDFCWRHLNLERVWLHVFRHNERAQRSYAKAGFKKEGLLRRAAYIDGSWVDVVAMAILRPRSLQSPAAPSPTAAG